METAGLPIVANEIDVFWPISEIFRIIANFKLQISDLQFAFALAFEYRA